MQPRIMIVDDDANIIKAIERMLVAHNYRFFSACRGAEALEMLNRESVELVISDYRMPDMDGIDFLKEVQARYPDTLTILMTAYADLDIAIRAINETGIYKFVPKPWVEADFVRTIQQAVEMGLLCSGYNQLVGNVLKENAQLQSLERLRPASSGMEM